MSGASEQQGNRSGYERLDSAEPSIGVVISKSKPKSLMSLPFRIFRTTMRRLTPEVTMTAQRPLEQKPPVKKLAKSHPLFNILDVKRSKKAMAKPEFLRYREFVKEGGTWVPADSNNPVIHFK
ncbi:hypothetical protein BVC80_1117g77 [Macleaya cordata]|uniref:Uncharacterized protein n=1 Tax=Macleaya cordata TaxID=56857 RepID=A0A200Q9A8_MACCD|nr:hypothetical protein BVC80_1117g77 [Macleaya cordata]